jgi:ATP-dependent 26S proteasome regulatory subunit
LSNELKGAPSTHVPLAPPKTAAPVSANASVTGRATFDRKHDELRLLINSRHPIISVETTEEERVEALLFDVVSELGVPLYEWSVTTGLAKFRCASLYNTDSPEQALLNVGLIQGEAVFVLKDFAQYCDNDKICRRLRELVEKFRTARRSIVITAASLKLPADLLGDAVPFQLGLPEAEELLPGVKQVLAELNREQRIPVALDANSLGQLSRNLVGLPAEEAMRALRMSVLARGKADTGLLDAVLDAKRDLLRSEGLIETIRRDTSFEDVVGLKRLREWIEKRKSALTPEGQRFGLVPPKGILITGVQGCGKSLAARAVAGEWGFELARLDAGALYDKYVGESERRLHRALELAQKLAPMVLWIDEIEKAFASAGSSGDADAGLSQRLLATLLTWMQDRESGVFLAATSNNITVLPPEMLRKGRFDEIFFVDLPGLDVRVALFALHLKKRGRAATAFDLPKLAAASEGFSGAEIEQAIASGLYTAFSQKQQLSTEVLLTELNATQPLSRTRAEDVQSIREWAKTRAAPAD